MKKQYVVFGADRFGQSVAKTLEENGCQVVIVDSNAEKIQAIAPAVSYALAADVTEPETIENLGLGNVDGVVITMVDHMDASIVTAMLCKEHGVGMIVARAKNDIHGKILEKIGVDQIVFPEQEMGERIGKYLTAQNFTDWIALSTDYSLVEFSVPLAWVGKSLAEVDVRKKYGLNVVGIRQGGQMHMQFSPTEHLSRDMLLYVIGSNRDLDRFLD